MPGPRRRSRTPTPRSSCSTVPPRRRSGARASTDVLAGLERGGATIAHVWLRGERRDRTRRRGAARRSAGGDRDQRGRGAVRASTCAPGQKTGFFLDQRDNRRTIRRHAAGATRAQRVLVHRRVLAPRRARWRDARDVGRHRARPRSRRSRSNLALIGPAARRARARRRRCVRVLRARAAQGRRWDLVIVDPPSFAPSERARPAALAAYSKLARAALAVVEPGGRFALASCSSHVTEADLLGRRRRASGARPSPALAGRRRVAITPCCRRFPRAGTSSSCFSTSARSSSRRANAAICTSANSVLDPHVLHFATDAPHALGGLLCVRCSFALVSRGRRSSRRVAATTATTLNSRRARDGKDNDGDGDDRLPGRPRLRQRGRRDRGQPAEPAVQRRPRQRRRRQDATSRTTRAASRRSQDDEIDDCPDGPSCPQCSNGNDDDKNGSTDYPERLARLHRGVGQRRVHAEPGRVRHRRARSRSCRSTARRRACSIATQHVDADVADVRRRRRRRGRYELRLTAPKVIVATTDNARHDGRHGALHPRRRLHEPDDASSRATTTSRRRTRSRRSRKSLARRARTTSSSTRTTRLGGAYDAHGQVLRR